MLCRLNKADRAQTIGPRAKSLECRAQNDCRVNAPLYTSIFFFCTLVLRSTSIFYYIPIKLSVISLFI